MAYLAAGGKAADKMDADESFHGSNIDRQKGSVYRAIFDFSARPDSCKYKRER